MGDFPFLASRFSYVSIQSLEDEGINRSQELHAL